MDSLRDWIETERTRLRPFIAEDAHLCHSWFSDPEVMRFIPGGADVTLGDTEARVARYCEHEATHGFSKRLIFHRETGEPIGDSGLFHLPDGERIELGFRLAKPYWGQGYALEVARAWLKWFDTNLVGYRLYADVHPDHVRSQAVLRKLGFMPSHLETVFGMKMWIYERNAP